MMTPLPTPSAPTLDQLAKTLSDRTATYARIRKLEDQNADPSRRFALAEAKR